MWRQGYLELHARVHARGDEDAYATAVGDKHIERHARCEALRDRDPQVKGRRLCQHGRYGRPCGHRDLHLERLAREEALRDLHLHEPRRCLHLEHHASHHARRYLH